MKLSINNTFDHNGKWGHDFKYGRKPKEISTNISFNICHTKNNHSNCLEFGEMNILYKYRGESECECLCFKYF